jgi:hypothetical protein
MSSLAPAPHPPGFHKRLLEEEACALEGARLPLDELNPQKRLRHAGAPPGRRAPRGRPAAAAGSHAAAAHAALRGLFPAMSDRDIAAALEECGEDVDAAIRRLNDLALGSAAAAEAAAEAADASAAAAAPAAAAAAAASVAAAAATPAGPAEDDGAAAAAAPPPRSAEEWVEEMVAQMSAAADVADARRRAAAVLSGFEQAALAHAGGAAAGAEALARENALLKRAVAIQNARLQELGGGEAAGLRGALDAARARVAALEAHNYSLQLHLKAAADAAAAGRGGGALGRGGAPDVF